MVDYYKILGVAPTDTETTIKKKYRQLAIEFHPDKNPGDKKAEERFKEIAEAWGVLGNQKKRKEYDSERKSRSSAKRKRKTQSSAPMADIDFEEMLRQFSENFEESINPEEKKTKAEENPLDVSSMFNDFMSRGF